MLASLSYIIPTQHTGRKSVASSKKEMECRPAASVLFNKAKHRLLNINEWGELCCGWGAKFQLTDELGNELNTTEPEAGNLIRITPSTPKTEDEYDWFRIERFETHKDLLKDEEIFGFTVKPISDPTNRPTDHYSIYTSEATSTFLILRKDLTVYVMEHGRNEEPHDAVNFLNKLKYFTACLASKLGLSKTQWSNLVNGILNH